MVRSLLLCADNDHSTATWNLEEKKTPQLAEKAINCNYSFPPGTECVYKCATHALSSSAARNSSTSICAVVRQVQLDGRIKGKKNNQNRTATGNRTSSEKCICFCFRYQRHPYCMRRTSYACHAVCVGRRRCTRTCPLSNQWQWPTVQIVVLLQKFKERKKYK